MILYCIFRQLSACLMSVVTGNAISLSTPAVHVSQRVQYSKEGKSMRGLETLSKSIIFLQIYINTCTYQCQVFHLFYSQVVLNMQVMFQFAAPFKEKETQGE